MELNKPEKTGYQLIDAALAILSYLFAMYRKNDRAFLVVIIIGFGGTGWGLYVKEAQNTHERIETARMEERESAQKTIEAQESEITALRGQLIQKETENRKMDTYYNKIITELYERLIKK